MKKKKICSFILAFLLFMALPTVVLADFGPKDMVVINVKNYPEGEYYLDLLQEEKGDYENIDISEYDPILLGNLCSYESEGWYPALSGGTNIPLFGELEGEKDGEYMKHTFSYFGVPSTYRIVIATKDGAVAYESITRKSLHSGVTLDYETGEITYTPVWVGYAAQYISTFVPTLIIEGIILILLGYSIKKNALLFILTNAFTQIILTVVAGRMLITGGYVFSFLRFFPVEMAILAIETVIYVFLLAGNDAKETTHTRGRKILYAVSANIISWGISLFFVRFQFEWIMGMLM
ncbi:MAG: hypothetical protein E7218_00075 [Anaerofustis stercorihominis]|nr:hypothetical protein [Anaerofustis stercorihominis]